MKNITIRTMSVILTIAIALTALAMPAFAAEIEIDDAATTEIEELYPRIGREVAKIPLFDQRLYANTYYGNNKNVAKDGDGITCLAMVATYLTERMCSPDVLADQFGYHDMGYKSYLALFVDSARELGMDLESRTYLWDKVEAALMNGQVVISLQTKGLFTNDKHAIVLTGMTEDGRITVNDPDSNNWDKTPELVEGFANGFTKNQIIANDGMYFVYGKKITEVPLYNQNDYPNIPYSKGSVATSGCGITSIAMVASYMLGREYLPDELALKYNKTASENVGRMENAAIDLGLEWEKVCYFPDIVQCLREGKVCIALMHADSIFTNGGHFVVLTGITQDGKILVNDPNGYNYNVLDGFYGGFEQEDVRKGCSGAWVFDKYPDTVDAYAG